VEDLEIVMIVVETVMAEEVLVALTVILAVVVIVEIVEVVLNVEMIVIVQPHREVLAWIARENLIDRMKIWSECL
jgi:hypothetical protein